MPVVSIRLPIGAIATPPRTPYATLTGPGARQRLRVRISNRHPVDLDTFDLGAHVYTYTVPHIARNFCTWVSLPPLPLIFWTRRAHSPAIHITHSLSQDKRGRIWLAACSWQKTCHNTKPRQNACSRRLTACSASLLQTAVLYFSVVFQHWQCCGCCLQLVQLSTSVEQLSTRCGASRHGRDTPRVQCHAWSALICETTPRVPQRLPV